MRTSTASRLSDFERLAREAAATVCKELGEPRTWFDVHPRRLLSGRSFPNRKK